MIDYGMKLNSREENIYHLISELEVIDAHSHLPPEAARLNIDPDFMILCNNSLRYDLSASGMPDRLWDEKTSEGINCRSWLADQSIPVTERWKALEPYFENIKYGAFARPTLIIAKEIYGIEDINIDTIEELTSRIKAANKKGLYNKILKEKCRIKYVLNESLRIYPEYAYDQYDMDFMPHVMWIQQYNQDVPKNRLRIEKKWNKPVASLSDYLSLIREDIQDWTTKGVIGLKTWAQQFKACQTTDASRIFDKTEAGEILSKEEASLLELYIEEEIYEMAAELGIVVAVHTGMQVGNPVDVTDFAKRHPNTKIDLFHIGVPYTREAIHLAKFHPNVWLNMVWTHIISPRIARNVLDDMIDQIPMNKIIGFGSDEGYSVENVYGDLEIARRNIACVLANRIDEGLITEECAVHLARKWLFDNPAQLYGLTNEK